MAERQRSCRDASEASLRRDTAAHLVDRVLPEVAIRQWVLTLPYPLRYRCAYDARLASEVLRAFIRSLFAEIRRRARSRSSGLDDQSADRPEGGEHDTTVL
jgi:hypothetical protein